MIPQNFIILSTNLFDEFKNPEEVAFTLSLTLVDYLGSINMMKPMEEDVKLFFSKILKKNVNTYSGRFNEDLKLILLDLKRTKDIKTYLFANPFFFFNFKDEVEELKKLLNDRVEENNFKKISLALDIMSTSGFNLKNLSNFNFDKIYYQIFDIVKIII